MPMWACTVKILGHSQHHPTCDIGGQDELADAAGGPLKHATLLRRRHHGVQWQDEVAVGCRAWWRPVETSTMALSCRL